MVNKGEATLDAYELSKRFGNRLLFRKLSFRLTPGETLAITGANGSGKSTLIRILAGLLRPSQGKVALKLDGSQLSREDHPLYVGLVAPYLNVYDGFSARENLEFLARARGLSPLDPRIDEMLDYVALGGLGDDPVGTFSSGMKQRVKFAAALLARPPVLLLDEPGVNLDEPGLEMVERAISDQLERRGLVIIATNVEAEAARSDHIIRIEDHR